MSNISVADLKKAYAQASQGVDAEQMTIELCYSRKTILVKSLKTKDKKELLKSIEGKNEIIINSVLDRIIEKYVELPDGEEFNYTQLTTQERQQILVYIRAANGDDECEVAHQCPKCEFVNKNISFKMNALNVKYYDGEPGSTSVVVLKKKGMQISLELGVVTRQDEIECETYIKDNKLKTMTEKQYVVLGSVIKSVSIKMDGQEAQNVAFAGIGDKVSFAEGLNTTDHKKITKYAESLDFGVTLPFEFECTKCGFTSDEEVNVAVFFIS
jgi:hypothetical protein